MRTIKISTLFALGMFLLLGMPAKAQTDISKQLDGYPGSRTLFFYKNTLRMFNYTKDEAFERLIKDVDKVRYVTVPVIEQEGAFTESDYKGLKGAIEAEGFEVLLSARQGNAYINAYVKGDADSPEGFMATILTKDDDDDGTQSLQVIDMKGFIDPNEVSGLLDTFQGDGISRLFNNSNKNKKNRRKNDN